MTSTKWKCGWSRLPNECLKAIGRWFVLTWCWRLNAHWMSARGFAGVASRLMILLSSQQSAVSSQQSALNGGDRNFEAMNSEAATRCFLVTAIHVFSCFPDGIDHLIERDHELTISG